MEPFRVLEAVAVPIDEVNVDTNQLCPTRFNKVPRGPAYERILFHDRRFNADGNENPDFILNREPYRHARIIVAERNFGCGSSRESAVYALQAFGVRSVIAPSFGDIFASNCLKNGLLPVRVAGGGRRRHPPTASREDRRNRQSGPGAADRDRPRRRGAHVSTFIRCRNAACSKALTTSR